jgi:hypothetical protein
MCFGYSLSRNALTSSLKARSSFEKFRWQILIHGPEGTKIPLPDRSILWKLIPKNVFLTIDVNPAEL